MQPAAGREQTLTSDRLWHAQYGSCSPSPPPSAWRQDPASEHRPGQPATGTCAAAGRAPVPPTRRAAAAENAADTQNGAAGVNEGGEGGFAGGVVLGKGWRQASVPRPVATAAPVRGSAALRERGDSCSPPQPTPPSPAPHAPQISPGSPAGPVRAAEPPQTPGHRPLQLTSGPAPHAAAAPCNVMQALAYTPPCGSRAGTIEIPPCHPHLPQAAHWRARVGMLPSRER